MLATLVIFLAIFVVFVLSASAVITFYVITELLGLRKDPEPWFRVKEKDGKPIP